MILRYARWPAQRLIQRLAGYTSLIACRCTGTRHDRATCAKMDAARIVVELHGRNGQGGPPIVNLFAAATPPPSKRAGNA